MALRLPWLQLLYGLEIPRWRYAYRGYDILRPGSPAKAQAPQAGNFP
ncbi:hypothetical protein LNP24_01890 [Klebsiella pneumoniae subsp. pneumoniae]|nr:hypothetical protein [Klebsiella pneumoniae subsp. pneumoniae]